VFVQILLESISMFVYKQQKLSFIIPVFLNMAAQKLLSLIIIMLSCPSTCPLSPIICCLLSRLTF
jgi:hypothetical protein